MSSSDLYLQKIPFISKKVCGQGNKFKIEFRPYAKASDREPRLVLSSTIKNRKGGTILVSVGSIIYNDSRCKVIKVNWALVKKWAYKKVISGGRVKQSFVFSTVEENLSLYRFLPQSSSFHPVIIKYLDKYGVKYFSPSTTDWGRHTQDMCVPLSGVVFALPSPYKLISMSLSLSKKNK